MTAPFVKLSWFMFERVRISRDPNVLHGIGLEGAGE